LDFDGVSFFVDSQNATGASLGFSGIYYNAVVKGYFPLLDQILRPDRPEPSDLHAVHDWIFFSGEKKIFMSVLHLI